MQETRQGSVTLVLGATTRGAVWPCCLRRDGEDFR
jgi:hypothetical protein